MVDRTHALRAGSVGVGWWSGSGESKTFELVSPSILNLYHLQF